MASVDQSPLQVRVREAILALGGFWRPSNAALRLLEELGELAEHTLDPLLGRAELAGECADLWIITTALADQFYGYVAEPVAPAAAPVDGPQQLAELVAAGGRIGRVVNYYDGPKNPRTLEDWPSLEQTVAAFHRHLVAFASTGGIDLRAAVEATLSRNVATDAGRFATTYDARTAPVLARFEAVREAAGYPFPDEARLFGAPDWSGGEVGQTLGAVAGPLRSFLRAAGPERLDSFVIGGPPRQTADEFDVWTTSMVEGLAVDDDAGSWSTFSVDESAGGSPREAFLLLRPVG